MKYCPLQIWQSIELEIDTPAAPQMIGYPFFIFHYLDLLSVLPKILSNFNEILSKTAEILSKTAEILSDLISYRFQENSVKYFNTTASRLHPKSHPTA